jgi:hypothetical protein
MTDAPPSPEPPQADLDLLRFQVEKLRSDLSFHLEMLISDAVSKSDELDVQGAMLRRVEADIGQRMDRLENTMAALLQEVRIMNKRHTHFEYRIRKIEEREP